MRAPRLVRDGAALGVAAALAVGGCTAGETSPTPSPTPTPASTADVALRDVARDGLAVGVAVAGGGHYAASGYPDPFGADEAYRDVIAEQFSSVTHENQLKWEFVRPTRDEFRFEGADAVIEFAEENGQVVRGHTLLWHSQNPRWLTSGEFTDDEMRALLQEHIATVVGRYKGRIVHWDVANEIFDDSGVLRTEENPFLARFGTDIVADALRWAHEADPDAVLYLNDFNVESIGRKSDAYYALAQELLAQGVPLHGFGVQGHLSTQYPFPDDLEDNLRRFTDLGLEVAITELDVRVPVDAEGKPDDVDVDKQVDYYRRAVGACVAVERCTSLTLWGVTDAYSWVPGFFTGEGSALVLDEDFHAKPAFTAVAEALAGE
ncbi:Endo-1,4-beta-xylanase [Cellulomonas flavigena DSM 20109]|uniref:Beta-xylanase n=1 Tax=Cellulomonas flavigena (strain ATCC 482 / DSM 20109 / BCRC 11376 / JCM 18109 / NBRC 3775 / NCIMB 8073 / NRS 134) TaxID=446466 RepID=D5UDG3_CELFN|nr:endo-1,4-beta-xylanase [Cellulomonas flavigena]ADG76419.1 Endo-1,4-beta-xylanase [Cellulomonas flavigena DSM 20109]